MADVTSQTPQNDTNDDLAFDQEADGGQLSVDGRAAAIGTALSLIGVYFSTGKTQQASDQTALSRGARDPNASDALIAALRVRTAIAASKKLESILDRVARKSNFRYSTERRDSIGMIAGRLDTLRYARESGRISVPPTFPVMSVQRASKTDENILAVAAAQWVLLTLENQTDLAIFPLGGPERRAAASAVNRLRRVLHLPVFSACVEAARTVVRQGGIPALNDVVRRRVEGGHVGAPAPYRDLVEWIQRGLDGEPVATPGDLEWSFYGADFDTRLFELWCLHEIAAELSLRLMVEMPAVEKDWRTGGPAFVWRRPIGTIELRYQQSLQKASAGLLIPRWRSADGKGRALGGIPDIVVKAITESGAVEFAVIDPKLRQRSGVPTEELYKILGYFENYSMSRAPLGAILHYTTDSTQTQDRHYQPESGAGSLRAISLNPAAPELTGAALSGLISDILALVGLNIPPEDAKRESGGSFDPEKVVALRMSELQQQFVHSRMDIRSSKERVELIVGEACWAALSEDVRTTLATAEHIGFTMDEDGDYSPPILGVCAALEHHLYKSLMNHVLTGEEEFTFGQVLGRIDQALKGSKGALQISIREHIVSNELNTDELVHITARLQHVVKTYRNPAAHRVCLTRAQWRSAWREVVGEGALLRSMCESLS